MTLVANRTLLGLVWYMTRLPSPYRMRM